MSPSCPASKGADVINVDIRGVNSYRFTTEEDEDPEGHDNAEGSDSDGVMLHGEHHSGADESKICLLRINLGTSLTSRLAG